MTNRRPVRRRNPDVSMRELERLGLAGDEAAQQAWVRQVIRAGGPSLQWVTTAPLEQVRWLPSELRSQARVALAILDFSTPSRETERGVIGGWFPDHVSVEVCPRGHRWVVRPAGQVSANQWRYNFRLVENGGVTTLRTVSDAEDGVVIGHLTVSGIDDQDDSGLGVLSIECQTCYADWPFPEDVELDYT